MENIHYLDNSATTQVLEEAAQAALRLMRQDYGNPSDVYKRQLQGPVHRLRHSGEIRGQVQPAHG